jgi:hypothetical protein
MSALLHSLRPLYDTPLGDRVRVWTGVNPPINIRPRAADATISDLFPWRVDATWQTCFELLNLPSLLYPDARPTDRATLVLFGADGGTLSTHHFELAPFEARRIEIEPLLDGVAGAGAFACFHAAPCLRALAQNGSHLSERGYVGFRRRGDRLWSYVHGNQHVLARAPGRSAITPVGPASRRDWVYRPQLRFDDAAAFDLVYANPVDRPLTLSLRLFGPTGSTVGEREIALPVRGSAVISHSNAESGIIVRVESRAWCSFWRPVVFKHYESHFDVFHG